MTGSITSRRTLVRTAAWTAPAIAVVATAPPASATSGGTLEVSAGGSYVQLLAYAGLVFQSFTVRPHGGPIAANQLSLAVTFAPTAPSTAHLLWSSSAARNSWTIPAVARTSPTTAIPVLYTEALADGQTTRLLTLFGPDVFTADGGLNQPGSFLVTASAPGFRSVTVSVVAPPYRLLLTRGTSRVVVSPQTGRAQLVLEGVTIASDPVIAGFNVEQLTMTVTFVPAAPSTAATLDAIAAPSGIWAYDTTTTDVPAVSFRNEDIVRATSGPAAFPNGTYVETHLPAAAQPGSFVVTLTSSPWASASFTVAVP